MRAKDCGLKSGLKGMKDPKKIPRILTRASILIRLGSQGNGCGYANTQWCSLNKRLEIIFLLSAILLLPGLAVASTYNVRLLPPQAKDYREPDTAIIIEFDVDILENVTTQLALELNAIDISSLVSIDGKQVIYRPKTPLKTGLHRLRLVAYGDDDEIVEIASWPFEVRQSRAFQNLHAGAEVSLNNSAVLAREHHPDNTQFDRYQANGAAEATLLAANAGSEVGFEGSFIVQDEASRPESARAVDLGPFLLHVEAGDHARLNVGHHALDYNSLIYQNFNRRGVSGVFSIPQIQADLQLFGTHVNDLQGFGGGLGIGEGDDRLGGIVASIQPVRGDPAALSITSAYISGTQNGFDTSGTPAERFIGSTQALVIASALLDRQLRLKLETARSSLDFDRAEYTLDRVDDTAVRFTSQYAGEYIDSRDQAWQWGITLERAMIEPDFYAMSNLNLVSDNDATSLSASLQRGAWRSSLFVKAAHDNLDGRFDSTNTSRQFGFDVDFSTAVSISGSALEHRRHRLSVQQTHLSQQGIELDADAQPLAANHNRTTLIELVNQLDYKRASGYLTLRYDWFDDAASSQSDREILGMEIGGEIDIHERHRLTASFSHDDTHGLQDISDSGFYAISIAFDSVFDAQAMTSSIHIDYEQTDQAATSINPSLRQQMAVGATLAKQVLRPKGISPGLDVQLRASYFNLEDQFDPINDNHFYEVFLDINLFWGTRVNPVPARE